ncbi:conserved hypothetical protein [Neospora caninum Liverpool]|uniref:Uncharacterized protein n=1 Tax=Neospora caninum (strain Liverpool) TaxID=572307 RepID=F0VHI7_NEOCL|nr:conserved hypothetical protein [Neospora caninum Liverpool]CBZ53181.1 conserved hypothetical protein [Neospora caninum Liverpool]CEL67170.1 TPA: hypothetical protein BN1204_029690 [Neospora caninum Liverpool]|eukprot:XP_003883213.1 conserved hypothetical protein [Neospora caninum Liverpool]
MFRLQLFPVFLLFIISAATSLCPDTFVDGAESAMEDNAKTVTFPEPAQDNIYTTNVKLSSTPARVKVLIESSAGSGGYAFMAHDVLEGIQKHPKLEFTPLADDEMKERLESSVSKHGVTVSKPSIEHVKQMPGASQTYVTPVEVTEAGDYTAIIAQLRPWAPLDGARFYVVHIHAEN